MAEISASHRRPLGSASVHAIAAEPAAADSGERIRSVLHAHYATVWRAVQAFGVPTAAAEDAAQRVFLVFSDKVEQVEPGRERPFLLATAARVAANERRHRARHPEYPSDDLDATGHSGPNPEQVLQVKQARQLLQGVLHSMPEEQRVVFVLFELEQLSLTEVALALGVPRGTVASRLRAARAVFEAGVQRLRSRQARQEGDQ